MTIFKDNNNKRKSKLIELALDLPCARQAAVVSRPTLKSFVLFASLFFHLRLVTSCTFTPKSDIPSAILL